MDFLYKAISEQVSRKYETIFYLKKSRLSDYWIPPGPLLTKSTWAWFESLECQGVSRIRDWRAVMEAFQMSNLFILILVISDPRLTYFHCYKALYDAIYCTTSSDINTIQTCHILWSKLYFMSILWWVYHCVNKDNFDGQLPSIQYAFLFTTDTPPYHCRLFCSIPTLLFNHIQTISPLWRPHPI